MGVRARVRLKWGRDLSRWSLAAWGRFRLAGVALLVAVGGCDRCKTGTQCETLGKCETPSSPIGKCFAATNAQCAPTRECRTYGRCTARGGECVVGSDADCHALSDCVAFGKCSQRGNECVLATHADCRRSQACKLHGRCYRNVSQGVPVCTPPPPKPE